RPWKRIRSAKAAEPPHLGQTLLLRGIAAVVVDALPSIGRAPASAGPRRLAPLRALPALGVSVGDQQSHYCDTEQNKTDHAHAVLLSISFPPPTLCEHRHRSLARRLVAVRPSWWPNSKVHIHGDPTGDAAELKMRPTTTPSPSTS